jgi:hypothetical protein
MLRKGLAEAGASLRVVNMPFGVLLAQYYRQQEREADMYFLGEDFPAMFDPTGELTEDYELAEHARKMLFSGFEDRAAYMEAWLSFQLSFAEELPLIPLYSGDYHDFYIGEIKGYDVASYGSWSLAIVDVTLEDAAGGENAPG